MYGGESPVVRDFEKRSVLHSSSRDFTYAVELGCGRLLLEENGLLLMTCETFR